MLNNVLLNNMSLRMRKPTIYIGESKGADQLRSDCEAGKRLCFRYTDSTPFATRIVHLCFRYTDSAIPLLSISKISSLKPSSVTVQSGLCRTLSEPKLLVFSRTGSYTSSRIYVKLHLSWHCDSLGLQ